ncbi:MAG: glycosyltransferase family 39 protein [Anaerolineae bacterium]|jgi:4-amino-4-deoxy-L-arabinose transferase-like glycosyltransferase
MKRTRLATWEWILILALTLVAWGLRVCLPAQVPPGWRDDELINILALTGQVLDGEPTIYFTGASGHEPLYHTLHAPAVALVGMNPLGAHLLSIAAGVLAVPLTYVLGRRLFGRGVGLLGAALLAPSFWALMYSRTAIRHALVVPLALMAFYFLWRAASGRWLRYALAAGLALAGALMTYTVSRMMVALLPAFGLYLALFDRAGFRRWWRPLLVALLVAAVLTTPMWLAIARGRSEAAALGIGADARISELARPLQALLDGDPAPLVENARLTLGMFHVTGDDEWLYNISGRPAFGPAGAVVFFLGLALTLWRWRRPEAGFLLIWLLAGLGPAIVTLPASSLGHTILAQPAVYLLVALPVLEIVSRFMPRDPGAAYRVLRWGAAGLVVGALCLPIAARDLRDYFVRWPREGMVRFLYRADYRDAAQFLDAHPQIDAVALGSVLMGPWDRLALETDLERDNLRPRYFDPQRALFTTVESAPPSVLVTDYPHLAPDIDAFVPEEGELVARALTQYELSEVPSLGGQELGVRFANGLELAAAAWQEGGALAPGAEATLAVEWTVAAPLDLPPIPVVANPPPPGVYSEPRLAVFAHVLAGDGEWVAGDDGLWVDPVTLEPGDRFVQVHRFALPADAPPGPFVLALGLYDPMTGERWELADGAGDAVVLPIDGEELP